MESSSYNQMATLQEELGCVKETVSNHLPGALNEGKKGAGARVGNKVQSQMVEGFECQDKELHRLEQTVWDLSGQEQGVHQARFRKIRTREERSGGKENR